MASVAVLAAPLAVEAQPAEKVYRIGLLSMGYGSPGDPASYPFVKALADAGYRQGRNVALVSRTARGEATKFPELATELVERRVDIIVAFGTAAAKAARDATPRIPIVFLAGDAVLEGLVPSLARPGGNLTGISALAREFGQKQFQLLKEAVPGLRRVAVLWDPKLEPSYRRWAEEGATPAGLELRFLVISGPDDFEKAFQEASRWGAGAVSVMLTWDNFSYRGRIASFAMASRMPTTGFPALVEAGGLMSYSPDQAELLRIIATYVGKILKGAKPADLPVEQPTRFELIINLKTAKALGLTIPRSLLLRADQVIE